MPSIFQGRSVLAPRKAPGHFFASCGAVQHLMRFAMQSAVENIATATLSRPRLRNGSDPSMPETRTITLRSAMSHDAEHVARLHTLSWQSAYSHILPAAYLSDEAPTEHASRWRRYFDRNEAEWGLVLIAESDGAPIGFVSAERPVDSALGVLLDCLHVLPAYHGSGIGKRMIEAVRAWTRNIGVDKVHLLVLEGNVRAIGFYEHNGWRLAGVETSVIGGAEVAVRTYVIEA
nr:GNAT family N-acetyltransferase [Burkholderia ambifaria]